VECPVRVRVRNIITLTLSVIIMSALMAWGYTEAYINSHNILYETVLTAADVWDNFILK
jgi:hypothetical protein